MTSLPPPPIDGQPVPGQRGVAVLEAADTVRAAVKEAERVAAMVTLTYKEWEALPTYTCSEPTGLTIGRRWKRAYTGRGSSFHDTPWSERWWLCEVFPDPDPAYVQTRRREIHVPRPEAG